MGKIKLERCPVCGRTPKLRTYGVNIAWYVCKHWYERKPHKESSAIYAQPSELIDEAAREWNEMVNCANLPVW